jgi:hypothetical protein
MNWASLIPAGIGALSSIFGGGQQTPQYVQQLYNNQNALFQKSMQLYNSTNMGQVDQNAENQYGAGTAALANQYLSNYNSTAAGAGSPSNKFDTTKDRADAQIAGDMASKAALYAANLTASEPQRQMALLPGMSSTSAMTGPAEYLQGQQMGQNQQQLTGLMSLARMFGTPGLFGGSGNASTSWNPSSFGTQGMFGGQSYLDQNK